MTYQIYVNAPYPFHSSTAFDGDYDDAKSEVQSWHPDEFVDREQEVQILDEYGDPVFTFILADSIQQQMDAYKAADSVEISFSTNRLQVSKTFKALTSRSYDYNGTKRTLPQILSALAADIATEYPLAVSLAAAEQF